MRDQTERKILTIREETLVPSVVSEERFVGVAIVAEHEPIRRVVATLRETIHVETNVLDTPRLDDSISIAPQRVVVALGIERADVRVRSYVYEEASVGIRSVGRRERFEDDVRREMLDVREAHE